MADRRGLLEQTDNVIYPKLPVGTNIEVAQRITDALVEDPDLLERLAIKARNMRWERRQG